MKQRIARGEEGSAEPPEKAASANEVEEHTDTGITRGSLVRDSGDLESSDEGSARPEKRPRVDREPLGRATINTGVERLPVQVGDQNNGNNRDVPTLEFRKRIVSSPTRVKSMWTYLNPCLLRAQVPT